MSDDLISRKALIENLMQEIPLAENVHIFRDIIENQPTSFDKEKVINGIQLSTAGMVLNMNVSSSYSEGYIDAAKDIIEIVKRGGLI